MMLLEFFDISLSFKFPNFPCHPAVQSSRGPWVSLLYAANRAVTNLDLRKKHTSTANTHLKHDATVTSFIAGVCSIFMHLIKFRWVTAPLAADTYLIRLFLGGNLLQLAKIRKVI